MLRYVTISILLVFFVGACSSESPASQEQALTASGQNTQNQPAAPVQTATPQAAPVQAVPQAVPAAPDPGAALGQMLGQIAGQQPGAVGGQMISWKSLSGALPTNASGWALQGEVEGESVNVGGMAMSNTSCKLKSGAKDAEINIHDSPANAALAMTINLVVNIDTNDERISKVNIGGNPAMKTYHKKDRKAEIMVLVKNRLLVHVEVSNADSEASAEQLAQLVNYNHLVSLIGG